MTVYTQPLQPGEKVPEKSYYFIKDDTLVATDHQTVGQGDRRPVRRQGEGHAGDASRRSQFTMKRNAKDADGDAAPRPLVRRAVRLCRGEPGGQGRPQEARHRPAEDPAGRRASRRSRASAATSSLPPAARRSLHRTFVYAPAVKRQAGDPAKDKYDLAMRMLDFPNSAATPGAAAVGLSDVASYLTFNWKMQDAFKYSETLVDAIAGDKGVFDEIWLSMKQDVNGPKIDIFKELIDHLGERATLLADVTVPVDLKSERLMALVEVHEAGNRGQDAGEGVQERPGRPRSGFSKGPDRSGR